MIILLNKIFERFGITGLQLNSDHVSQVSWLGWGQGISLVLSLISIKLTTAIGPTEYGRFVLATSIGGLLSLSFFGPLEQGMIRYYFEFSKSEGEKSAYLLSALRIIQISAVVLCIIAVIVVAIAVLQFNQPFLFLLSASILVIISAIGTPFNGLFNAMKLRREVSTIQVLEKLCIVILLSLASVIIFMTATVVMGCIVLSMIVFLIVRMRLFNKQLTVVPEKNTIDSVKRNALKMITMFSLPFVLWGWLSWLQFNGERWVINSYLTINDVGKYGLSASLINNSIVLVYGVFIQFVTPSVYGKFSSDNALEKKKGYLLIKLSSVLTFILFLLFGFFLLVGGEGIIHLISSKEYVIDAMLLLLLSIAFGFFYVGQTLALLGFALQKPHAYIFPKIISAILSIVSYIFGCMWYGIFGIVIAMCAVNLFYLLCVYGINRQLLRKHTL